MRRSHVLLAVMVSVIWGVNFVAIELGLQDVPPLVFVALRFTLVALPAVFFVPRPPVSWKVLTGIGLFMSAGQFGLVYLALHLGMPAGLAPLVLQSQMIFIILIAAFALKERPSGVQLLGVGFGVVGLGVVALGRGVADGGGAAPILPLALVLLAGLSWGVGNTIARAAKGASGLGVVVWSALVVPVPVLVLALAIDGPEVVFGSLAGLGPAAWMSTVFTVGLASLVGYSLWNSLLARYPAAAVVPYTLLVPPVGMVAAWLAFGEVPAPLEILGGAIVLAGLGVTLRPGRGGSLDGGTGVSRSRPSARERPLPTVGR